MSEMEELRRRLEALEARVDEVVEQQAATRHLAVNSDRDVAALQEQRRADMQLLQALRTTQIEHGKTLRELGTTAGVLLTGQIELARVQDKHTEKLDSLTMSVDAILRHLGITDSQYPED
ncbi:hypothetical protein [Streptomyces roseochromogenus]|uniref:Uncharacterized protein n=1 Tax=Streptomyces roseochromogenus subsp. oscitans DS 12.976 TaxID=1352936 RepID=V6JYL0_STRRC|nr:hypothetical protein [Streptomyces roseochromogenus]EST24201.1 hypothetical protein M878_31450 [Streptomyces roseochromogenus subsp. oscitans DS 12.976]